MKERPPTVINDVLENLGLVERRSKGLEAQIMALQSDVHHSARNLSRRSVQATDGLSHDLTDFGREPARQVARIGGAASQQAIEGAKALSRDPLQAITVIATAFLMVRLLRR